MAYDDEEQLEAIRGWWQRHGKLLLIGVATALAVVVGYQQWNAWQARQAAAAASDYTAVLAALNESASEAALNRLEILQSQHADSPYAGMATLAVAAAELADGRALDAAQTLAWLEVEQADSPMRPIAGLRRAEALAAAGEDQQALAVLDAVPQTTALQSRLLELRGDLLAAQGDAEAAITAYREALSQTTGQRRALVEVKLLDLGGMPAS